MTYRARFFEKRDRMLPHGHRTPTRPAASHAADLRPRDPRRPRDGSGLQPRCRSQYRALGRTHRRHHNRGHPRPRHDRRKRPGRRSRLYRHPRARTNTRDLSVLRTRRCDDRAYRAATPAQIDEITKRIETGLREGAVDIGAGFPYTPAATRDELLAVFRVAATTKTPIHVHIRPGV